MLNAVLLLPVCLAGTTPSPHDKIAPTASGRHSEVVESSRHAYRITLGGNLDADNTLAWRKIHGRSTMESPLFQPNVSVTIENISDVQVDSAWLVVNGNDWYDIDSLLATATKPDRWSGGMSCGTSSSTVALSSGIGDASLTCWPQRTPGPSRRPLRRAGRLANLQRRRPQGRLPVGD